MFQLSRYDLRPIATMSSIHQYFVGISLVFMWPWQGVEFGGIPVLSNPIPAEGKEGCGKEGSAHREEGDREGGYPFCRKGRLVWAQAKAPAS